MTGAQNCTFEYGPHRDKLPGESAMLEVARVGQLGLAPRCHGPWTGLQGPIRLRRGALAGCSRIGAWEADPGFSILRAVAAVSPTAQIQ